MLRRKEKIIEIKSDEERDSYPYILRKPLFDPEIPVGDIGPSSIRSVLRQPTPEASSSSEGNELNMNNSEQALSLDETPNLSWTKSNNNVNGRGKGITEQIRLNKKKKLGHRTKANSYPIDFMRYSTTQSDLHKLRDLYRILDDIHIVIPEKGKRPS